MYNDGEACSRYLSQAGRRTFVEIRARGEFDAGMYTWYTSALLSSLLQSLSRTGYQ